MNQRWVARIVFVKPELQYVTNYKSNNNNKNRINQVLYLYLFVCLFVCLTNADVNLVSRAFSDYLLDHR